MRRRPYQGKWLLDLAVAIPAIILVFPLLLSIAGLVRIRLGRPILFCQRRPGLHGRPFTIVKFRTMTDARDVQGNLLPDAERLTPLGRFLRRTSLDELPELMNVLKGDMSLVGPRPLLFKYLPYYTPLERKRFDVRPGITGLAQVSGRNHSPWDVRLAYDAWYVEHCSLCLDLSILWRTVEAVWLRDDVLDDPRSAMQDLDEVRANRATTDC